MSWRPTAWREALTPEFGYPEAWIAWALRGILALLAVYSLAVTPQYTTRPLLVTSALFGLVISLAFAFIPTRRPRTLKGAECAVLGMFVLHVVGHALGFYARFVYYDKVLHFVEPITIAITFYALSQSTDWVWQWRRVTPFEVFVYCWAMVVALGALWEILEFGMDTFFHTQEQNGNTDTMLDLIFDTLGGLVGSIAVAVATKHGREHGFETVAEEPKSSTPKRHFTRHEIG